MAKRKRSHKPAQPVKQRPSTITAEIVDVKTPETSASPNGTSGTRTLAAESKSKRNALVKVPDPLAIPQSLDTDAKLDDYLGRPSADTLTA